MIYYKNLSFDSKAIERSGSLIVSNRIIHFPQFLFYLSYYAVIIACIKHFTMWIMTERLMDLMLASSLPLAMIMYKRSVQRTCFLQILLFSLQGLWTMFKEKDGNDDVCYREYLP